MSAGKYLFALVLATLLTGCGLSVPEIQENPFASEGERSDFIQAISQHVKCEIQDAVIRLYTENPKSIDPQNRNLAWFDPWAVQYTLTLTTDEKGSLGPSVNLLPPSPPTSIFNVNLGATLSSEGQRINKIGAFYTVAELKRLQACTSGQRNDGVFIQGNLKLYDWLKASMIAIDNADFPAPGNQSGPLKTNVLSQEVKFDVISTGTVSPAWKLTTVTINQTGTLLSGTRDRTQDLSVVFGPTDPSWSAYEIDATTHRVKVDPKTGKPIIRATALAPTAAGAVLSADISNGITNGIRNALH